MADITKFSSNWSASISLPFYLRETLQKKSNPKPKREITENEKNEKTQMLLTTNYGNIFCVDVHTQKGLLDA